MRFGVRNADAPKSSGNSAISWFGKNDTRIRFLEEIDDWTKYQQHFSASARTTYPCTGDKDTCPGCIHESSDEARTSTRYLVNAVDTERGYVNLYSVPFSCMASLERSSDRDDGTIRARDYTVVQTRDDNNQVKYLVEREEKSRFDFGDYVAKMKDHQDALSQQFTTVWGDNDSPDSQSARRTKDLSQEAKDLPAPRPKVSSLSAAKSASAKTKDDLDPPTEPQIQKDTEPEETMTLTEDEIRSMDVTALLGLFDQVGIDAPESDDSQELAEYLLSQLV